VDVEDVFVALVLASESSVLQSHEVAGAAFYRELVRFLEMDRANTEIQI